MALMKSIKDHFGGPMARAKKEEQEEIRQKESIWIPTGSTLVDLVVGGGRGMGYEAGQIINVPSDSGAGKTLHCNEIIANAYKMYGKKTKWVYDAAEHGNTFDFMKLYGIEIIPKNEEDVVRSNTIQQAFANIETFIKKLKDDEFGIYVLDSLDAVMSQETDDIADEHVKAQNSGKEFTKGTYQGEKPKFLSSIFFPRITELAKTKKCLVLIISQLRDNVGGGSYAPKDKISNGRALTFYSDTRVWFRVAQRLEKNNRQIGATIEAWTTKVRGETPYRNCFFTVYYTYGVDNVTSNIDFLYDLRTAEKGELRKTEAKALDWDGEVMNREELIKFIEEKNLEDELSKRVVEKWYREEAEATEEISSRKRRF
jgi:RecA/RadA recombinase